MVWEFSHRHQQKIRRRSGCWQTERKIIGCHIHNNYDIGDRVEDVLTSRWHQEDIIVFGVQNVWVQCIDQRKTIVSVLQVSHTTHPTYIQNTRTTQRQCHVDRSRWQRETVFIQTISIHIFMQNTDVRDW